LKSGDFAPTTFAIPVVLALLTMVIGSFLYDRVAFRRLRKKALANAAGLVVLDNDYRRNLWQKMEFKVRQNLMGLTVNDLWRGYGRSLTKIEHFLNYDLKMYYEKIGS